MPETTPKLGLPIPPGGDSSVFSRDLRAALLGLDAALDSAPVDIPAGSNVTAGYARVHRMGNAVTLSFAGTVITGAGTDNGILQIPTGYRPVRSIWIFLFTQTGVPRSALIGSNGNLQVYGTQTGEKLRLASPATYTTADPLPA